MHPSKWALVVYFVEAVAAVLLTAGWELKVAVPRLAKADAVWPGV
jgi:hypothetical protein